MELATCFPSGSVLLRTTAFFESRVPITPPPWRTRSDRSSRERRSPGNPGCSIHSARDLTAQIPVICNPKFPAAPKILAVRDTEQMVITCRSAQIAGG